MATQVRITIKCPRAQNATSDTIEQSFGLTSLGEVDTNRVKSWLCDQLVNDKMTNSVLKLVLKIMELNYKNDLEVKIKDVLEFRMKPE